MSENDPSIKYSMFDNLNEFADELRKRGFYVEVGHSSDDIIERFTLDIIFDKSKKNSDDFYG